MGSSLKVSKYFLEMNELEVEFTVKYSISEGIWYVLDIIGDEQVGILRNTEANDFCEKLDLAKDSVIFNVFRDKDDPYLLRVDSFTIEYSKEKDVYHPLICNKKTVEISEIKKEYVYSEGMFVNDLDSFRKLVVKKQNNEWGVFGVSNLPTGFLDYQLVSKIKEESIEILEELIKDNPLPNAVEFGVILNTLYYTDNVQGSWIICEKITSI